MKTCGTYSGYTIHIQKKIPPCDDCKKASRDYQRNKRREKVSGLGYDPRRFKKHNITKEYYDELLNKYAGKCWVCKDRDAFNIDHNHDCCTGSHSCGNCVRGILCNQCNTALGLLKDSKEILKQALDYLD